MSGYKAGRTNEAYRKMCGGNGVGSSAAGMGIP